MHADLIAISVNLPLLSGNLLPLPSQASKSMRAGLVSEQDFKMYHPLASTQAHRVYVWNNQLHKTQAAVANVK